ncbi:MAG: hypothetical protein K8J31_22310 [Anaerolineae bacterium]|nr:hypothetical protein [Anaerolineae bacterium]
MLVRLAVALTLLFTLAIGLIRAQPYDRHIARQWLLPAQGCAAPCFLGMRPGETTFDEAAAFFKGRSDTEYFVSRSDAAYADLAVLYWRETGTPLSGTLHFADEQLAEMTVNGFKLYEIWLELGEPDGGEMVTEMVYLDGSTSARLPRANLSYYRVNQFRLNTSVACVHFWNQNVYITMGETVVPEGLNREPSLTHQRQAACAAQRMLLRAAAGS